MLLDGTTGQIKTVFDPHASRTSEPSEAIPDLTQQILGFWPVKDQVMASHRSHRSIAPTSNNRKGRNYCIPLPHLAVQAFTNAIALDADYIAPRMSIIQAHYLNGDIRLAYDDISRIKSSLHFRGKTKMCWNWEYLINGEYQRAFDTLRLNLDLDPENAFVQYAACTDRTRTLASASQSAGDHQSLIILSGQKRRDHGLP